MSGRRPSPEGAPGAVGGTCSESRPAEAAPGQCSEPHEPGVATGKRFRPQAPGAARVVRPGLARRLAALVYDALLLFAVLFAATVPVLLLTGGQAVGPNHPVFTAWLLAVSYLYLGWCWTRNGQTLGMRAWRMRVCLPDGRPLGWRRSLGRFAAALVSVGAAGVGLLWVAVDRDRLSLHDRLSGTVLEMVSPER